MAITPIARTVILTDSGTRVFTADLAEYDGTSPVGTTIDNTLASSTLPGSSVAGMPGLFGSLDGRAAQIASKQAAQQFIRTDLNNRISELES